MRPSFYVFPLAVLVLANMNPAHKIDPALPRAIPPIDAGAPADVQTATFALG